MALATLGRGERVSRIQFCCITAFCDALAIQIPTSKSDIVGLMSYAKACFANCAEPTCCLATALGVEFLSRSPTGNFQFLFGESGENSRYIVQQMAVALRTIIDSVGAANLGTTVDRLTTHFLKKTGLRLLRDMAAGIIDDDSKELRADHKVGPYSQRSEQDGVVGRTLAFLKPGTSSFALSPPHFHETIIRAIPWARIVPGYTNYTIETRQAVHLAVASAMSHADFLTKNMSTSHPFHGCPLMSTEKAWLPILKPYLLGGIGPFTSCLVATGCSLISNMAMEVHDLTQGGGGGRGVGGGGALSSEDRDKIDGLMAAVVDLKQVMTDHSNIAAQDAPAHSNALVWSRIMPRLWLNPSFKFPVRYECMYDVCMVVYGDVLWVHGAWWCNLPLSVKLHDAWLRWHCGAHPLRAVTSKMLPKTPPGVDTAERERQCGLRRKFKGVFDIIQGQTPDSVVDMDVEYVWDVCWNRTVSLFNVTEPCNWVVSTAYDVFHRQTTLVTAAKASPTVAVPDVALAAAARAARVAADTRAFAQAALQVPSQRRQSAAAQIEPSSATSALQFSDDAAAAVALAIAHVAGPVVAELPLPPPPLAAAGRPAAAAPRRRSGSSSVPIQLSAPDPFVEAPAVLALNPHWPVPNNLWMPGAVQCALCCSSCLVGVWQNSHRGMLNHYRASHNAVFQLGLTSPNVSGPENVIVIESCWCIKGIDGDGTASTNPKNSWTPCKRRRAA
jgi:hypothetical protein